MMPGASISDAEKAAVRAAIFTHLAGLAVAPTVGALWERGALDVLTGAAGAVEFSEILASHARERRVPARRPSAARVLRVAHRAARRDRTPRIAAYSADRRRPHRHDAGPPLYGELTSFFLPKALILEDYVFGPSDEPLIPSLRELVQRAKDGWRIAAEDDPVTARVRDLVRGHLDGMLIGPAMVALARHGVLDALEEGPVDVHALEGNAASLSCLFDLLTVPGWTAQTRQGVQLTGCGRYAAQIASSYGVTVSYLPMFGDAAHAALRQPAHAAHRSERVRDDGEPRDERVGQRRRAQDLLQEAR